MSKLYCPVCGKRTSQMGDGCTNDPAKMAAYHARLEKAFKAVKDQIRADAAEAYGKERCMLCSEQPPNPQDRGFAFWLIHMYEHRLFEFVRRDEDAAHRSPDF